jgi:SAM-dependent methyltransferase
MLERVPRHVRLREFLVGVEGVALMRHLFAGDDDAAQRRIAEVRRIAGEAEQELFGAGVDVPEVDARSGYAAWSQTYDQPGNPLISVEQPAVWALLDASAPGRAVDAACGTGRHARRLVERGHDVVGVDASPEMLERARAGVPEARFVQGDLRELPIESADVDLVICALALEHLPELAGPVGELARIVRPGGRVVISTIHPVLSGLGGAAYFLAGDGTPGVVRGHRHLHGEYLDAFAAAGLETHRCLEPLFESAEAAMQGPASALIPDATDAAYVGLPGALVWDLVRA